MNRSETYPVKSMQNYKDHQVDLSNCDSEPIHIIGRIQPHGFLLVIDATTQKIEQVSQNLQTFLEIAPDVILGKNLQELVTPEEYATLLDLLQPAQPVSPQLISWQGHPFFCFIHQSENKIILEGESYTASPDQEKLKYNNLLSGLNQRLSVLDNLQPAAEAVAEAYLTMLNYDRVEVIQFDPDWNSEVIAEARTARLNSYLGHHFPASDIPAQARDLLVKKHIRQIPNVHAKAVDIIPYYNPTTGAPTNIIQSELRNPSEIHLEYVKNMGVAATISFSILVKGKLWGLISCHNVAPIFITVWQRQIGDLIAKSFANIIQSMQEKRNVQQYNQFRRTEEMLIKQVNNYRDIRKGLFNPELNILQITESTGAALFLDNELTLFGNTPAYQEVEAIIEWLTEQNTDRIFCTRELTRSIHSASAYRKVASGLIALEISRYNKEYLMFFKPEIKETRIWAGNPEKPTLHQDNYLHPRLSFAKWEEVIKGKSLPWTLNEQEITQLLLKDVVAIRLRNQATQMETLNKELHVATETLQVKNKQLEDFAHIMSHNLRSPLVTIDGLHEFYTEEPNPENAAFAMERIKLVSINMAETIDDLNVILKTRLDQQIPVTKVLLAEVIEKEIQNLAAVIAQTQADIQLDLQVAAVMLPKIYVESILHNFISNALKYYSPNRTPIIVIRSWLEQNQVHISVIDNGLGMDLKKMGHKLFGLYKTFHWKENAKGLGLYLTKLQVDALGGSIKVVSEPGQGTTFTVSFPVVEVY